MNIVKKNYIAWERKIKRRKDALLEPFYKLLIALKITPNFISCAALLLGLGAALSLHISAKLFLLLIVFSLIFDMADGGLARYQGQKNDLGFWLDYTFDRIVSLSIMMSVYLTQIGNGFLYLLNPLLYLIVHLIYAPYRKSLIVIYIHPIYYLLLVFNFYYATILNIVVEILNLLIFSSYLLLRFWKRHFAKSF